MLIKIDVGRIWLQVLAGLGRRSGPNILIEYDRTLGAAAWGSLNFAAFSRSAVMTCSTSPACWPATDRCWKKTPGRDRADAVMVRVPGSASSRSRNGVQGWRGHRVPLAVSWTNLQIVVVDNGSTDGSPIWRNLKRRSPCGRAGRASAARNVGLAHADGDLIQS